MADANSPQMYPCKHSARVEKACEAAHTYLLEYGADASVLQDVKVLLAALAKYPTPDPDPVVCSRLSMVLNHHIWQYWYYEGIPLLVRVAYWAAVEAGLFRIPDQYGSRWGNFIAHLMEIKAREIALHSSDMAGGWLFPGEPQALWEIASLACGIPGDFLELGTWTGRSATLLCAAVQHFSPQKRVILIDNWEWGLEGDVYPFMAEDRNIFIELERQLQPYADIYLSISGLTIDKKADVKSALHEGGLALIHHDAGHRYEDVFGDLIAYLPMLEDDGYLIVHDYNNPELPDIHKAVDDIIRQAEPTISRVSIFNTIGLFRKRPAECESSGHAALGVALKTQPNQ